jgi:hypothetical protein
LGVQAFDRFLLSLTMPLKLRPNIKNAVLRRTGGHRRGVDARQKGCCHGSSFPQGEIVIFDELLRALAQSGQNTFVRGVLGLWDS